MARQAMDWRGLEFKKKVALGMVESMDSTEVSPLSRLFESEGCRSARLAQFFQSEPSGQRDVEPILRRMERERGTWLREVLDACED